MVPLLASLACGFHISSSLFKSIPTNKQTNQTSGRLVNAHAEFVIANMRSAFAARGKRGVEMAWWHTNNFPQHRFADVKKKNVLDDVIEDVLARGVIGDEADGFRVRDAVGV